MRLDKFLQAAGIFKRRAAAKGACEEGRVLVGGAVARPAKEVSSGQVIEIQAPQRRLQMEVLQVPAGNVGKAKRSQFIRILEEKETEQ